MLQKVTKILAKILQKVPTMIFKRKIFKKIEQFVLCRNNVENAGDVIYLPLYAAAFL